MKANTNKGNGRANPLSEITATALKNYEQAMHSGLKLQEETLQWWSKAFNQAADSQGWQKGVNKVTGLANELAPMAQERLDEVMVVVENSTRTGTELMKQAIDAAQTTVIADSQAKWMEFWASSVTAARTNATALTKIGSKAVDSWIDFLEKNTEITSVRVPKAA